MQLSEMTDRDIDVKGRAALDWLVTTEIMRSSPARVEFNPAYEVHDAYMMESRLAEMGLAEDYAHALYEVLGLDDRAPAEPPFIGYFELIHASPRDRCRAALRAVRDAKKSEDRV